MKNINIIKVGGNVIDDPPLLEQFLANFAKLKGLKILVHGGGKSASEMSRKLGIEPKIIAGRRITDIHTLDVATMVYAGLINKKIVAALQSENCDAIGLTGADAALIPSKKRPVLDIDYGFVGDVETDQINSNRLGLFLENNLTPVFCAITFSKEHGLLNTNADTIASSIAIAMSKNYDVSLNFCFEKKGVLKNVEDENSVINVLSENEYKQMLLDGNIHSGMIPKLDNTFAALRQGVSKVWIGHASNIEQVTKNQNSAGTTINL